MTRSTSHIENVQVEDNTVKLTITNSVPKTVMGSGIAPPRLCNDHGPTLQNQSIFKTIQY
jgi:hypothetical protein